MAFHGAASLRNGEWPRLRVKGRRSPCPPTRVHTDRRCRGEPVDGDLLDGIRELGIELWHRGRGVGVGDRIGARLVQHTVGGLGEQLAVGLLRVIDRKVLGQDRVGRWVRPIEQLPRHVNLAGHGIPAWDG